MVFEFKPVSYVSHETFPVSTSSKEERDWEMKEGSDLGM